MKSRMTIIVLATTLERAVEERRNLQLADTNRMRKLQAGFAIRPYRLLKRRVISDG
jgi:hypothetical protein